MILADATIPFTTLVDVLYTAGRAEYRTYDLVAVTESNSHGAVHVEPPQFDPEGGFAGGPPMKVFILGDGLRVLSQGKAELLPVV